MASSWYLKVNDEEVGPLPFPDLVEMVRDGKVIEGDLVRPDWKDEWQAAWTVVGLYYMAGRPPRPVVTEDPPVQCVADAAIVECDDPEDAASPESLLSQLPDINPAASASRGRKNKPSRASQFESPEQIDELEGSATAAGKGTQPFQPSGSRSSTIDYDSLSGQSAAEIMAAAAESTGRWSRRKSATSTAARTASIWGQRFIFGMRIALAIACAIFVAYRVEKSSKSEAMRKERQNFVFRQQAALGLHAPPAKETSTAIFGLRRTMPLVGECDGIGYLVVLAGLVTVVASSAFVAVQAIESSVVKWSRSQFGSAA